MNYCDYNARQETPAAGPSLDVIEFEPVDVPAGIEVHEQQFESFDDLWAHLVNVMRGDL